MQEKQKAKYSYGVLEKQFRRYYEEATKRHGKTGDNLLQILESRLDNVVYARAWPARGGAARQLVSHGHFLVNGQKVNNPELPRHASTTSSTFKPKSLETTPFLIARETQGDRPVPAWLQVIPNRLRVLVHQLPDARPDRCSAAGAADRRALLQVKAS